MTWVDLTCRKAPWLPTEVNYLLLSLKLTKLGPIRREVANAAALVQARQLMN